MSEVGPRGKGRWGGGGAQERQASGARRAAEEEAYEGDDRHREIDDEVGVHFEQSCSLTHLSEMGKRIRFQCDATSRGRLLSSLMSQVAQWVGSWIPAIHDAPTKLFFRQRG
jgi:hypothetical protein